MEKIYEFVYRYVRANERCNMKLEEHEVCLLKDFVAQLDTWGYTICKKKEDEE